MSFSVKPVTSANESNLLGIEPDETVSSQEDTPLPYFAGVDKFALRWITPQPYNRTTKAPPSSGAKKGGGNSQANHINYGDVAGFFALGPIDKLLAIIIDDQIVWEGIILRDVSNPVYAEVDTGEYGIFRVYWGTDAQTVDTLVLSGTADDHPAYKNIPYCVGKGVRFGIGKDAPGNIVLQVERTPNDDYVPDGIYNVNSFEGASALACVSEVMLDPFAGLASDESIIDADQWDPVSDDARFNEAFALFDNASHIADFGHVSPKFDKQQPARRVINDILSYIDGFVRVNDGMLQAGLAKHDGTVEGSLPSLTHHEFVGTPTVSPLDRTRYAKASATFRDRRRHMKRSTVTTDSSSVVDDIGYGESTSLDLSGFQTEHQGDRYLSEFLQTHNQMRWGVSGRVFRDALQGRREGDQIQFDYSPLSIDVTMRIVRIDDTDHPNIAKVNLEQEPGLFQLGNASEEVERVTTTYTEPGELANKRVFQLPKSVSGGKPALWFLAEKVTPNSVGFKIHYSGDDSSFDYIGNQESYALRGALDGAIADSDLTLNIDATGEDIDKLQSMSSAQQENDELLLIVNDEVLSIGTVTANGSDNYTVGVNRGRWGTVAASHSDTDEVWVIERSTLETFYHQEFPRTVIARYFKLQPFTSFEGERDLANVTSFSFSFADLSVGAPLGFAVGGIYNGFVATFVAPDADTEWFKMWYSETTTRPDDPVIEEPAVQGYNRTEFVAESFVDVPKSGYFWAQLGDDDENESTIVGPVFANSGSVSDGRQRVIVKADTQFSVYNPSTGIATPDIFNLVCLTPGYFNPTFQWYYRDGVGTRVDIVGETNAFLQVDQSDIGDSRTYGCEVSGNQYDELTLFTLTVGSTDITIILDNEIVTVFSDAVGNLLAGEVGSLGPTVCRVKVFKGAGQFEAVASGPSSNQWSLGDVATGNLNTGLAKKGLDTFYLDDGSVLSGSETTFAVKLNIEGTDVTVDYKVIRRALGSLSARLEVSANGPLVLEQPITAGTRVFTAKVIMGADETIASRTASLDYDADGNITINTAPEDDGSGILATVNIEPGIARVDFDYAAFGITDGATLSTEVIGTLNMRMIGFYDYFGASNDFADLYFYLATGAQQSLSGLGQSSYFPSASIPYEVAKSSTFDIYKEIATVETLMASVSLTGIDDQFFAYHSNLDSDGSGNPRYLWLADESNSIFGAGDIRFINHWGSNVRITFDTTTWIQAPGYSGIFTRTPNVGLTYEVEIWDGSDWEVKFASQIATHPDFGKYAYIDRAHPADPTNPIFGSVPS